MNRLFAILLFAFVALSGCGDEEVTGPTGHDYLPGQPGDGFISKTVVWDISGDTIESSIDSWEVMERFEYGGHKDAIFLLGWDLRTLEMNDDSIFLGDWDNGIHTFDSPADFAGLSQHELSKRWIKVADFGTEEAWTTLDTNLTNVSFTINGQQYTGSGRVLQKISPNEGSVIVFSNLGGTAVLARCFAQVTFYDFTLDVSGQPTKLEFTDIENFCIARDRGTVKRRREAYLIPFGSQEIEINGYETLMAASHAND